MTEKQDSALIEAELAIDAFGKWAEGARTHHDALRNCLSEWGFALPEPDAADDDDETMDEVTVRIFGEEGHRRVVAMTKQMLLGTATLAALYFLSQETVTEILTPCCREADFKRALLELKKQSIDAQLESHP